METRHKPTILDVIPVKPTDGTGITHGAYTVASLLTTLRQWNCLDCPHYNMNAEQRAHLQDLLVLRGYTEQVAAIRGLQDCKGRACGDIEGAVQVAQYDGDLRDGLMPRTSTMRPAYTDAVEAHLAAKAASKEPDDCTIFDWSVTAPCECKACAIMREEMQKHE